MAAGLGFKDFVTGEVLTAADVDGYLMQGVWVFASAAARDSAVTSPQEGNFAYLKDTNVTTYYTGSAWANLDTTGMTNPMTTTGDTIYSSSGSTPARLGIGTANQILRVNSGATAPEWATVSSGGMTLINSGGTTLTGSSVTISSIPSTYKNLWIVVRNFLPSGDDEGIQIRFNGDSNANRYFVTASVNITAQAFNGSEGQLAPGNDNGTSQGITTALIHDYSNSTTWKMMTTDSTVNNSATNTQFNYRRYFNIYNQTAAVSSITLLVNSGTFTSGTAFLYGVS
jgi:hypothetical protein